MTNEKVKTLIKQLQRNVHLLETDTRIAYSNITVCHEYLASFASIISRLENEIHKQLSQEVN